jgi:hypothetical protein
MAADLDWWQTQRHKGMVLYHERENESYAKRSCVDLKRGVDGKGPLVALPCKRAAMFPHT